MPNGDNCLTIAVDKEQWENMSDDERWAHTFYCLRYLVKESQRNKLLERLITFVGSLCGSIAVLGPMVYIILEMHKR